MTVAAAGRRDATHGERLSGMFVAEGVRLSAVPRREIARPTVVSTWNDPLIRRGRGNAVQLSRTAAPGIIQECDAEALSRACVVDRLTLA